jgi:hypothetical protein
VRPQRGPRAADRWSIVQAGGFLWRIIRVWAVLLTASILWRDALDWWVSPTDDFYARSVVSTAVAAALFTAAGMWSAARTR